MMNEVNSPAVTQPKQQPENTTPVSLEQPEWKGMTLEQLRLKRAVALVRREMGKERMSLAVDSMRTRVADNGVRGLLFDNKTISGLKTADYALLGWRLARMVIKLWRKR